MEDKVLSRDEILASEDLPVEEIYVKEWGGRVRVRGMTAEDRDHYEQIVMPGGKIKTELLIPMMVAMSVVDQSGARVFTDKDIPSLQKKSIKPQIKIFRAAQRLSGIRDVDIEEMKKNSESGQPD